jgi:hypothetical protein
MKMPKLRAILIAVTTAAGLTFAMAPSALAAPAAHSAHAAAAAPDSGLVLKMTPSDLALP